MTTAVEETPSMTRVQNPPTGCQRVIPHINYDDAGAAIAFLCDAFGFTLRFRMDMPDGRVGHAELGYQDNVLMVASSFPEMGLASPRGLAALHGQILVYVDDVDAHHARARAAGAAIAQELTDTPYGDRCYRAIDPEGHRWMFATHVFDPGQ